MLASTEFLVIFSKINRTHFFALSVCSSPCVGPLPKIKIFFFLLSVFVHELISTPKVITFLPTSIPGYEKCPCPSNPIPYPEYL